MAIWPFKRRKRSSPTAEGKRPAIEDNNHDGGLRVASPSRNPSRRRGRSRSPSSIRSDHDRGITYGPPITCDHDMARGREFQPRKLPRIGGLSSYFGEHNRPAAADDASSTSSHRPHKQSSFLRRLSKRRPEKPKSQPPIAYRQTQISRQSSKGPRERFLPDRPISSVSTAPRGSLESQVSSRTYKIRKLGVFSPHPTLHYDDCSSPTSIHSTDTGGPRLTPSRSNSRRTDSQTPTWRYKAPLVYEENLNGHRARVDDLVDELDSRGLREAMERDQRRRERKKRDYEEQLRLRLERKVAQQREEEAGGASQAMEYEDEAEETEHQYNYDYPTPSAAPCPDSDNQTPLSWLNTNQSAEDVSSEPHSEPGPDVHSEPRPDVIAMDDEDVQQEISEEEEASAAAAVDANQAPPTRAKTSAWTSFIKRATAARIRKEHSARTMYATQPAVESDPDEERRPESWPVEAPRKSYLDVEDLRHREGQTPGRHISSEIALAMTAVETGRLQDRGGYHDSEYEDELRDAVHPTPPLAPYHHQNASQNSSRGTPSPLGLGLRSGVIKGQSPVLLFDESKDSPSPTIPIPHARPPSAQRYSPSFNRYSPGGASPEHGPRSLMSSSLASIDSEGSWLSGKITGRQSVPQLSPLRTSASSLRKRYQEPDGDTNMADDDYFAGVGQANADDFDLDQDPAAARLDLDDTDDDDDDDEDDRSAVTEDERNMWREGMKKMQRENSMRLSHQGMLVDYDDDRHSLERMPTTEPPPPSPDTDVYTTPLEHPFTRNVSTRSEYKTPLEHPTGRSSGRRGR